MIQIVTPEFYASVWDEDITKKTLAVAGFWMMVGNFIMYPAGQFQDLIDGVPPPISSPTARP